VIVAEAAATYLVARSNTEAGRRLNRFIHTEVLPQIRRTGAYRRPMTGDQLVEMALAYREHERRIMAIEEEQDRTRQAIASLVGGEDYATAKGFARMNGLPTDRESLNRLGRKAAARCRERGTTIGKVHDEMWGEVNSYPRSILSEASDVGL